MSIMESTRRLNEATSAFLVPLRMGHGFDDHLFAKLCAALAAFAQDWEDADMIPKLAANVLEGLVFDIDSQSYQYKEDQQRRIQHAAAEVHTLVGKCVWVAGE